MLNQHLCVFILCHITNPEQHSLSSSSSVFATGGAFNRNKDIIPQQQSETDSCLPALVCRLQGWRAKRRVKHTVKKKKKKTSSQNRPHHGPDQWLFSHNWRMVPHQTMPNFPQMCAAIFCTLPIKI